MVGQSSSSSWRTPSVENAQKYNLVELEESFIPTNEEKSLLNTYDQLRQYERDASRLKEQAAKDKLAAADAKYQQSLVAEQQQQEEVVVERKKKARTTKRPKSATHNDDDERMQDESSSEEEEQSLTERREAKLAEMRNKLNQAKQTNNAQEVLREQLLQEQEASTESGPLLKRKKMEQPTDKSALLANLDNQATPPHEFSKKLELKPWAGTI